MGHEPDEDGLPSLDVVIPDDARELDREVQAYRRELRWRRRRERLRGLARAARRYGTTTPLIAGVLLLASLSAAFLMLSVRLNGQPLSAPPPTPPTSPASPASPAVPGSAPPGAIGEPLPDISVVAGTVRRLRELHPGVFALVPARCRCLPALNELVAQSRDYGIPTYLVDSGSPAKASPRQERLAARLGGPQWPRVIEEPTGTLARRYGGPGLTAVLVDRRGIVTAVIHRAAPGTNWQERLAPLRGSWDDTPAVPATRSALPLQP